MREEGKRKGFEREKKRQKTKGEGRERKESGALSTKASASSGAPGAGVAPDFSCLETSGGGGGRWGGRGHFHPLIICSVDVGCPRVRGMALDRLREKP